MSTDCGYCGYIFKSSNNKQSQVRHEIICSKRAEVEGEHPILTEAKKCTGTECIHCKALLTSKQGLMYHLTSCKIRKRDLAAAAARVKNKGPSRLEYLEQREVAMQRQLDDVRRQMSILRTNSDPSVAPENKVQCLKVGDMPDEEYRDQLEFLIQHNEVFLSEYMYANSAEKAQRIQELMVVVDKSVVAGSPDSEEEETKKISSYPGDAQPGEVVLRNDDRLELSKMVGVDSDYFTTYEAALRLRGEQN